MWSGAPGPGWKLRLRTFSIMVPRECAPSPPQSIQSTWQVCLGTRNRCLINTRFWCFRLKKKGFSQVYLLIHNKRQQRQQPLRWCTQKLNMHRAYLASWIIWMVHLCNCANKPLGNSAKGPFVQLRKQTDCIIAQMVPLRICRGGPLVKLCKQTNKFSQRQNGWYGAGLGPIRQETVPQPTSGFSLRHKSVPSTRD